jgi:hypothetical protein
MRGRHPRGTHFKLVAKNTRAAAMHTASQPTY